MTKKKWLIAISVLVVGAVAVKVATSAKKPASTLGKVTRSDIAEIVTETGTITLGRQVSLTSPTNGIVEKITVKNGDAVKSGQELFTIKSTATEQEKSLALANYLTAKTALDAANSNLLKLQAAMFSKWQTFKDLAENDTYENADGTPKYDNRSLAEFHINEKTWLAAEADYKQQQQVINQAKAAASSSYLLYQATQHATIKATADGIISNLSVTQGSPVTVTAAKPLAIIADFTAPEVLLSLSETDAAKVAEGQPATMKVKPLAGKSYQGTVVRVDQIGTEEKGVVHYYAYAKITDADDRLKSGMNADVTVMTAQKNQVLSVPNAAVKPYKGGRAVRVNGKNGAIDYVPVETGIRGKELTEIITGLTENQEVIISLPNDQLKRSGLLGF